MMASLVLQSRVVHTDDTPLPVLDKTRDQTRQGRIWVYLANDHPYTVFDFTPSRARDGPQQFLGGFKGYLQADAFAGYDGIYLASQGTIHEVACNAHARRKFFDARPSDAPRAHAALAWYRQLYGIEHAIRDQCQRLAQEYQPVKRGVAALGNIPEGPVLGKRRSCGLHRFHVMYHHSFVMRQSITQRLGVRGEIVQQDQVLFQGIDRRGLDGGIAGGPASDRIRRQTVRGQNQAWRHSPIRSLRQSGVV
jgi:hypothetical protein